MISSRYIDKIVVLIVAIAVLVCMLLVVVNPSTVTVPVVAGYEQMLFDVSRPADINIIMDNDKWAQMLANPYQKTWYSCDVLINGTRFYNVGIRVKGDSSLESIAQAPGCDRFSFKLEFDKYNEGQKCWGLDKLCLNNNYGDATNMKEALIYDMFQYIGADASLYNYASVSVNGSYWGVYLALEGVEDSFLSRNYGNQDSALYKPGGDVAGEGGDEWGDLEDLYGGEDAFFDEGEGGANLDYTDDALDSYRSIWECQIGNTSDADHMRVIEALKNISEGNNLESYMDIDNIARYMAVHNFSVNNDSLSGDGAHNYYLYESGGRLNIIPWDYNLCFGAYEIEGEESEPETAESMINRPIDDSWALTSFFDGILQSEEYLALYHKYYQQLTDHYVTNGGFEVFFAKTRMNIDTLVQNDPNALYSYDAYENAVEMFKTAVQLRGLSVREQLAGNIPSTTEGQRNDPSRLIRADDIDLSVMGSDNIGEPEEFEADWENIDWESVLNEYVLQQNEKKKATIRTNIVELSVSLMLTSVALIVVRALRRKRI